MQLCTTLTSIAAKTPRVYHINDPDAKACGRALAVFSQVCRMNHPPLSDYDHQPEAHRVDEPGIRRFGTLIGVSPAMVEAFELARRASTSDSPTLLSGESGTGKKSLARAIHDNGPRRAGPFVAVQSNSSASAAIGSELFGHARGVFAGATADRIGQFEASRGGTLYIDELGEMPRAAQAHLLRALETGKITPLGAEMDRAIDVRVIAGIDRLAQDLLAEGRVNDQLYYCLGATEICLPPLRQRREDIPLLAAAISRELADERGQDAPAISPDLMQFFERYNWPGNIRQLSNCLESMIAQSHNGLLDIDDLPHDMGSHGEWGLLPEAIAASLRLSDMERAVVIDALRRHRNNRTRTAESLGISVRTLQRKLKRWNEQDHSRQGAESDRPRGSQQTDLLFIAAIGVWNRALDAHRASAPYRQMLARCESILAGRPIGVRVYEDDPGKPVAHYSVRFQSGLLEPTPSDSNTPVEPWNVNVAYLRDVVRNAAEYVRSPERLNWQWLSDRLDVQG